MKQQLVDAWNTARQALGQASAGGHWIGRLSSSALSTATAISALSIVRSDSATAQSDRDKLSSNVTRAVTYLTGQQNPDGGFGDTDKSYSNLATTMLTVAALRLADADRRFPELIQRAEHYIATQDSVTGLRKRYGRDQSFAEPILANCALASIVPWTHVQPLPFEAAMLPQSFYRWVRLPVVSYAIPALVAIGQLKYHRDPPRLPWVRAWRALSLGRTLQVLKKIQPVSGGYLEAIPLTSFVVMALASIGKRMHPVTVDGIRFLRATQRADGSWPIDTNLAAWVTNLATDAMQQGVPQSTPGFKVDLEWLLRCQNRERHPFTGAAPGGWGWSDLSGAVPDADDTPAALLTLHRVWQQAAISESQREAIGQSATRGVRWLLDLQNRDGGWPTFCRGWGTLPFDRSGSDLTAHALRALHPWRELSPKRIDSATIRGWRYLAAQQRADGSWIPLWFGNQDENEEQNPIYGTCKVLAAYRDLDRWDSAAKRGMDWLVARQNADGGWGGGPSVTWNDPAQGQSSVEETALAVDVLTGLPRNSQMNPACERGVWWLIRAVRNGSHTVPSPIGFYFAKLWYYEDLYPLIFTVSALGRAMNAFAAE